MPKAIGNAHDAILEAARRLLAEQGYEHLGMRAIAAGSGLATGTLYNYYRAKDEIVYALMLEDWSATLARMDASAEERRGDPSRGDSAADLLRMFQALRDFFGTYSAVWRAMAAMPREEKSEVVRAYSSELFRLQFEERIRKVLPAGGDPDEDAFLSGFLARILSAYSLERDVDAERLEVLLRVLCVV